MGVTQAEGLVDLLRANGERGVTPLDALEVLGSFRLAARVIDARDLIDPWERIDSERATLPNGKSVARYVLRSSRVVQPTLWD
jgi:hypothetical protein